MLLPMAGENGTGPSAMVGGSHPQMESEGRRSHHGSHPTQVDMRNIYNEVYQLKRSPGESPCDDAMAKRIC